MGRSIFVTGGTGYIGRLLIPQLVARGHDVTALARQGSEGKVACRVVVGDPLVKESFADKIRPADTFIQMVGVPHPSPSKGEQFRAIDLVSIRQSVPAAKEAGIRHFVYISVAQPAPIMREYIEVRAEGERLIRESGMNATFLRPWYVLGPGHRWPYLLVPAYWICRLIPWTRAGAKRLGLVTIRHMIAALVHAVENPSDGIRIVDVPGIRSAPGPL